MTDFPAGSIWLVGAGPGDPELLTRKAARLIAAATMVFHDALVSDGVLTLADPAARIVDVGKRSGRHSQDQGAIDAMIVAAALAGERVVRLKGGDPAVFGRAAEEVAAARAAAASLGVSLTLRGVARKLILLNAHALCDPRRDRRTPACPASAGFAPSSGCSHWPRDCVGRWPGGAADRRGAGRGGAARACHGGTCCARLGLTIAHLKRA